MDTPVQTPSEVMLTMMEQLQPILAAVIGFRAQCEAEGFSPTAAEAMAVVLHEQIIRTVFRPL